MSFSKRTTQPTLQKSVEAENLCEKLAVSEKDGFHKIFPDQDYAEISETHSAEVREAEETIRLKNFNWGGQGNMSLNYNLAEATKARNILETGVAYGWSSLSFLLSLENRNVGSLVSVDMPFFGVEDEAEVGCAVPEKLKSRWSLIRYLIKMDYQKYSSKYHRLISLNTAAINLTKVRNGHSLKFGNI